jgi:hypothetical protein
VRPNSAARLHPLAAVLTLVLASGCGDRGGGGSGPPAAVPVPRAPSVSAPPPLAPPAEEEWFVDEAAKRGVTLLNQTGEPGKKQLIMAAVGPGGTIFDASGDGRMDLFIPNGSWLVGGKLDHTYEGPDRPRDALYVQQPDGTFRDEAKERGVDDDAWGFGSCAADLDNDGDQDLLVTNLGPNRLWENDGTGHFRDVAEKAGFASYPSKWSTGVSVGDYDRDGLLDVYVSNYADMFLWLADPRNFAVKRDAQGNILDAAVCDWQGLMVYCGPKGLPAQQDQLYRNLGGGLRFEDATRKSGVWRPAEEGGPLYGFQALFTDYNDDGWPDLYVANDSVPSFLFENRKDGTFVECAKRKGVALSTMGEDLAGMGADSADLTGDGLLDILKTNFALQEYNVYVAARTPGGEVVFTDRSTAMGVKQAVYHSLGWGVLPIDYDNDGDLDVYFANGHVYPEVDQRPQLKMTFAQLNQLFRNDSTSRGDGPPALKLVEVTDFAGPGLQVRKSSRGAAMGDVDDDGDPDILVVNLNATPDLLINRLGSRRGHWLRLKLRGDPAKKVNLDAVGTKIRVCFGSRRQFFETKRGQSFLGSHDPRLLVGLGAHEGPVRLEITWPDGEKAVKEIEGVDREVTVER